MITPKKIPFKVEFFLLNEDDHIVAFKKGSATSKEQWGTLQSQLAEKCQELFGNFAEQINRSNKRLIRILFLNMEQLSGTNMLNVLANAQLEKFAKKPKTTFAPMITIGTYDIMSLYAYPYEQEMAEGSHSKILRSLKLDPRYKFLDSSIWFRYIPLIPLHDDELQKEYHTLLHHELSFIDRATALLNEICDYWTKGLYYTNAAVATLELQLRLLRESHITSKIGDGGHAEAVTPFKFHSESFLRKRAQQEKDFLIKPWGKEGFSIGSESRINVLIVDDQACSGLKLSAISEKYEKCMVSKKDLIIAPLEQVFNGRGNIAIFTPKSSDQVIQDCLDHLKTNYFDLIFLDYLLGDRHGNNGGREYGHEFLLDLLNDRKGDDFTYKRGFQGRFWIFSISSFPFALPDKLHQLGISHLQNLWHLSYGGDPITTPHLYAYYLFRFIKQKVSTYFLHPELLLRTLKENPVEVKQGNEQFWAEYVETTFGNWQKRIDWANRYARDPFTESIASYSNNNFLTKDLMYIISKINKLLMDGYIGGQQLEGYFQELASPLFEQFEPIRAYFLNKVNKFSKIYEEKLRIILKKYDPNEKSINLENLKLHKLSSNLDKLAPSLQELILSGNHFLSFPNKLFNLKKLTSLNLANNRLLSNFSGDITTLPNLRNLNLEGTKIAKSLSKPYAQTREEVIQLWEEIMELQRSSNLTSSILFFGLSPERYPSLRITEEFQIIQEILEHQPLVKIKPNFNCDWARFIKEITNTKAQVVHIAAHADEKGVFFKDGHIAFADITQGLLDIPHLQKYVKCIVLNACNTDLQAEKLSQKGIYVIGISGKIEDDCAIKFSEGFYISLPTILGGDYANAFKVGKIKAKETTAKNDAKRDIDDGFPESKNNLSIQLWYNGEKIDSSKEV